MELQDPTAAYFVGTDDTPANNPLYIQIGADLASTVWTGIGLINLATYVTVNGVYQGEWSADTKLDKKTTEGISVYSHNGTTQNEIPVSSGTDGNTVAVRTNGGQVRVGTPQNDSDATTKSYVDSNHRIVKFVYGTATYMDVGDALQAGKTPVLTKDDYEGGLSNTLQLYFVGEHKDETEMTDAWVFAAVSQASGDKICIAEVDLDDEWTYRVVDRGSTVSGTNDGTNWTTITINGTTYSIPSGGGGGSYVTLDTAQFITGKKSFGKIGTTGTGSSLVVTGDGAIAAGYINNTPSPSTITASGDGSFAGGYLRDSGGAITASGDGSVARGYCRGNNSYIRAVGSGAIAHGNVGPFSGTASISASGAGSVAIGNVSTAGSGISTSQSGSIAMGIANGANHAALAEGAAVFGINNQTSVYGSFLCGRNGLIADSEDENPIVFGVGVGDDPSSRQNALTLLQDGTL